MDNAVVTPDTLRFLFAVCWSIAGFSTYLLLTCRKKNVRVFTLSATASPGIVRKVVLQRIWGVILLGLIPLFIWRVILRSDPADIGWNFTFASSPPAWSYLLVPLIILLSYLNAPKASNLAVYPLFRVRKWSAGLLLLSGVTWVLYLAAYEFMFRGLLLHTSLEVTGAFPAIALNCLLYSAAHLGKGPSEILGAVPVGILLCYLTMVTGNIWMAVLIHSVMALTNEWFSIRAHPEMSWRSG